uniref:NADH-ubiquinone oxidoreductase chain 6 n=1 Tax=Turbinellus floccosus TaxID=288723 RepID=A0A649UD31_9AGAM|nr:NADH dehydrogenase subunit 6 [Turbinellus floccosus]QGI24495.1 NADH dehydrogenase subunit 6 [Turbinellus floccosus]
MNNLLLDLLAFASVFSSILVITSKNPVVAVIYLISVFLNAAGYLLILGVGFVGISYIILYVGAITVLFLFVLMSINIKLTDILEAGSQYTKNIPLAFTIGILFSYELISHFPRSVISLQGGSNLYGPGVVLEEGNFTFFSYPVELFKTLNQSFLGGLNQNDMAIFSPVYSSLNPSSMDTKISSFLQIESLGQELYTHGASWLILCSLILLLSLVAPIFISRNNNNISLSS